MRRGGLFWGTILILGGGLLLLDNLELINVDVWELAWPLFLIAIGVWTLFGRTSRGRRGVSESISIPLEGAGQARIKMRHGAGRLSVRAGTGGDEAVSGTFVGGLDYNSHLSGDRLEVDMRVQREFIGWFPFREGNNWSVSLNDQIPLSLDVEVGANESDFDLSGLKVTEVRMRTGASATELTLPAKAGHTRANVKAGIASVRIRIPDGVAARIKVGGGVSSVNVDGSRFPRSGDVYRSADYDTAENKVDLDVETGVGSLEIS